MTGTLACVCELAEATSTQVMASAAQLNAPAGCTTLGGGSVGVGVGVAAVGGLGVASELFRSTLATTSSPPPPPHAVRVASASVHVIDIR